MDVHRDFCQVAIAEAGEVRAAGRIESRPEAIEQFAQSLASDDQVVMEATYGAAKIAKLNRAACRSRGGLRRPAA